MIKRELVWNVFIENINARRIEVYNIFEHGSFYNDLIDINKNYKEKDEFLNAVRRALSYYYQSKAEWEITLHDWPPHENFDYKKVDVFTQVNINWDIFAEYLWNNRDLIRKRKK